MPRPKKRKLQRTIGLISATSIGLGAMLGAGIFVFPGIAGGYAGMGAVFSFVIGGIIALLVAMCTAELSTAMPLSGGGYYFISRTFGEFWGTLTGISQWIGLIFACAFYLVSFGEYAISFLEEMNINWNINTQIFSFVFTLFLLLLNIAGTKKVGKFQNIIVISLTIMLVLIFSYGLVNFFGIAGNHTVNKEIVPNGLVSILSTTALIFTSYLGFVQIANIGGEIKSPNENLPKSLIGSVLIAIISYSFILFVCTIVLPYEELRSFGETATIEVSRKLLGNLGAIAVILAAVLATLSSANASMVSASRGVFALSKDRIIHHKASKINEKFGTPHVALILVTLPIAVMLIRSRLEIFAEVASLLHLIIYAGICFSVLKLRYKGPVWYVPTYRVPFYKIISGLGGLSCIIIIFFMEAESIIIGLGILILAVVYYFLYAKKKDIKITSPSPPHIDVKMMNPRVLIPVDITKEKKDLPEQIMNAIPVSEVLLLGYKEIPEQSEPEQSEKEFKKEGKNKLENIKSKLEENEMNFEEEFIYSNRIDEKIMQLIGEKDIHYILTLKPLSELNQLVIPVYDKAQINTRISTTVHNLLSSKTIKIKVVIFKGDEEKNSEMNLKSAISKQLNSINININQFEILENEEQSILNSMQKIAKESDIVLWPEAESSDRKEFLKIMLEEESERISAPVIMILRN